MKKVIFGLAAVLALAFMFFRPKEATAAAAGDGGAAGTGPTSGPGMTGTAASPTGAGTPPVSDPSGIIAKIPAPVLFTTIAIAATKAMVWIANKLDLYTHYSVTAPGTYALNDPDINAIRDEYLQRAFAEHREWFTTTLNVFGRKVPVTGWGKGPGQVYWGMDGTPADARNAILGSLYIYAMKYPDRGCPYTATSGRVWFVDAWPEIAAAARAGS